MFNDKRIGIMNYLSLGGQTNVTSFHLLVLIKLKIKAHTKKEDNFFTMGS